MQGEACHVRFCGVCHVVVRFFPSRVRELQGDLPSCAHDHGMFFGVFMFSSVLSALSPQIDAAKQETSEALVNLERERHKLSMLEVEVSFRPRAAVVCAGWSPFAVCATCWRGFAWRSCVLVQHV